MNIDAVHLNLDEHDDIDARRTSRTGIVIHLAQDKGGRVTIWLTDKQATALRQKLGSALDGTTVDRRHTDIGGAA